MDATNQREFYAFRHPDTGQLARVREQGHEYRLSSYDTDPVFEVDTPEALALVLFENTPGYNSRRDCPGWGMFSREELVPVKVRIETSVELFALPPERRVATVSTRSIPYVVARRYAGGDLAGVMPDALVAFWLVELPEGVTLEDARQWEGLQVADGESKYLRRTLYKALAVPDDYPELAGKNAALFLASTL
jgi:hypothetical protein